MPEATPEPTPAPIPPVVEKTAPTPGWRTTEFWSHVTLTVGMVAFSVAGVLPGKAALIAAGISSAGYAISRGLVKLGFSAF